MNELPARGRLGLRDEIPTPAGLPLNPSDFNPGASPGRCRLSRRFPDPGVAGIWGFWGFWGSEPEVVRALRERGGIGDAPSSSSCRARGDQAIPGIPKNLPGTPGMGLGVAELVQGLWDVPRGKSQNPGTIWGGRALNPIPSHGCHGSHPTPAAPSPALATSRDPGRDSRSVPPGKSSDPSLPLRFRPPKPLLLPRNSPLPTVFFSPIPDPAALREETLPKIRAGSGERLWGSPEPLPPPFLSSPGSHPAISRQG